MGVARLLPLFAACIAFVAQASEPEAWKRKVAGAEVDWRLGTITAEAGSAADIRMPGPNAARPGAERRARASAEDKLRAAMRGLGQGKAADAALAHARVSRIEYQSNGGVVLWLTVTFSDVCPGKESKLSLKLPAMPFEVAPKVSAAGKTVQVSNATYRPSSESPRDAIPVRRDGQGQLVLPATDATQIDSFAHAAVVIYLDKAQP